MTKRSDSPGLAAVPFILETSPGSGDRPDRHSQSGRRDRKGRILAGNDVFVRVSGYPRVELVGQPHNIIRHPDMPRTRAFATTVDRAVDSLLELEADLLSLGAVSEDLRKTVLTLQVARVGGRWKRAAWAMTTLLP